ncbi:MAG: hypothetical protein NWF00_04325 [Candidatus Bathyarchaeota archaeon]|nr:hypothetical protein [Candidatus Bathyarchaeota archaeon]
MSVQDALEGTTLTVYVFTVGFGKPVGTRDVVRGLGLSSSSVAYRHLQKLAALGLLSQTESGEYIVKEKVSVRGYVWVGRYLLPRVLVYSFLFMAVLAVEVAVLVIHFGVESYMFKVFFVLMVLVTVAVAVLFLVEGVFRWRRLDG